MYKNEMQDIGIFHIGNKMRVSDPCYAPDVWCSGVLDTVPGDWEAGVIMLTNEETGGLGKRVAVLAVKHTTCSILLTTETVNLAESCLHATSNWYVAEFVVGVDSGQAGFFDDANFVKHNGGRNEEWYDTICNITHTIGTMDDCAVSSSGYGDGGYACVYHLNSEGKVDFAYIVFIDDGDVYEED